MDFLLLVDFMAGSWFCGYILEFGGRISYGSCVVSVCGVFSGRNGGNWLRGGYEGLGFQV